MLRRLVEAAHPGGEIDKEDGMTWTALEAEKAFTRASRARRRAALVARLRRARLCGLTVFDEARRSGSRSSRAVCETPISVVRIGDAYAIRDGHHRVSVAKALGAPGIPAIVA